MNKKELTTKNNTSTISQRNTPADALLSVSSQQISSFTTLNFNNKAKLTGVANPTRDTDVVPLQYLQMYYLSKNDPNPGYLPIQGGNMFGNINMAANSIFNLKQPTEPILQLPEESTKPKDPREEKDFADKTAEEQELALKEYDTELAEYQKKIDDYNAAWQTFYSEAATVEYVQDIVKKITENQKLDTTLAFVDEVETKIELAYKALGIKITKNPDAPQPIDIDGVIQGATSSTTTDTSNDNTSYDKLPSIINDSPFVLTQSNNTLKNDLKMTNSQISNIKTPENTENDYAANVTYLESKLKQPKRAFVSNSVPFSSTPISINGHIPWLSTNGSSNNEPNFKTSLASKCFETTADNLKIKTPGLLVLSARGTWSGNSGTNSNTLSVNLTVTPDSSSGSGSTGSTTTASLSIPLTLISGNSIFLQIPITDVSNIKMATTSGGSGGSSQMQLSSWSWEASLYPTDVPSTTTTPTPPPPAP